MLASVSSLDIVIGERFHSVVIAILSGVPFIAISYDQKVNEIVQSVGMSDYLVDIQASVGGDFLADELESKLCHLREIYQLVYEQLMESRGRLLSHACEDKGIFMDSLRGNINL